MGGKSNLQRNYLAYNQRIQHLLQEAQNSTNLIIPTNNFSSAKQVHLRLNQANDDIFAAIAKKNIRQHYKFLKKRIILLI